MELGKTIARLALATSLSFLLPACESVSVRQLESANARGDGLLYHLSRKRLEIEVEIVTNSEKRTDWGRGCQHLPILCVSENCEGSWFSVAAVTIHLRSEADPESTFEVNGFGADRLLSRLEANDVEGRREQGAGLASHETRIVPIERAETSTRPSLIETRCAGNKEAENYAAALGRLRDNRVMLMSGGISVGALPRETFDAMLEKTDQEIRQFEDEFVIRSESRGRRVRGIDLKSLANDLRRPGGHSTEISLGPVDDLPGRGAPDRLVLIVQRKSERVASALSDARWTQIVYRVPVEFEFAVVRRQSVVSLHADGRACESCEVLWRGTFEVPQAGELAVLTTDGPSQQSSRAVRFDRETKTLYTVEKPQSK